MTIDFDDLFDFEEKFNETEPNHFYQQRQQDQQMTSSSSSAVIFDTDGAEPTGTSSHAFGSGPSTSTADGFSGKTNFAIYSSSIDDRYNMHSHQASNSSPAGFPEMNAHKHYQYGSSFGQPAGGPARQGTDFQADASAFFLSHDFSNLDADSLQFSNANARLVPSTTSRMTNRDRETGVGMTNDRSMPGNGAASSGAFVPTDLLAAGLGDDSVVYQGMPYHRASITAAEGAPIYMAHSGAHLTSAGQYGPEGGIPVINATEYQLNEDIKNASATLSVLHQHSHNQQSSASHQMTHPSLSTPMPHPLHSQQQFLQPTHYYAQGATAQYVPGASGPLYAVGQDGRPMEQLVASPPTTYHPLLSNHVVLSPIPNHSLAQTNSIPISNSAYGLPGPHSLIAVASSPVNVGGSILSTSCGSSGIAGSQIAYISQSSGLMAAGISAGRNRKKTDDLIPYPASTDKLYIKRERNRLAAERCRRKKLELIDALQAENERLKMEVDKLRMELVQIQQMQQGQT